MDKKDKDLGVQVLEWYKEFCNKNKDRQWLVGIVSVGMFFGLLAVLYAGNIILSKISAFMDKNW